MIEHRGLHALEAVAEHETVTAAAAALNFTPSAVSQQIAQLSDELGAPLLQRQGRRVRLTEAARVLLQRAQQLSTLWEETKAEITDPSTVPASQLRLCGVSSAIAALLAPATACLNRTYPQLEVSVIEEETTDCYRLLALDTADIAVVLPTQDSPPRSDPRFEQRTIAEDKQDVLVPAGHPLAERATVELAELAAEPWIAKRHDNDTFSLLTAACASAGFTPHIVHEAKEWYAISALVSASLGLCLLPRVVPVPAEHHVVRIPLHGPVAPTRQFVASVRRGSSEHPLIRLGLHTLTALANQEPAR